MNEKKTEVITWPLSGFQVYVASFQLRLFGKSFSIFAASVTATAVFCFLPRGQAASLHPSSSGLEAAGQPLSQQKISMQSQLETPSRSFARAWVDQMCQEITLLWRSVTRKGYYGATL